MTPERWEAIDRVWQAVLARPAHERAAAVVELSAGDEALRRDVESLLDHLSRANDAGFGVAPLEVRTPAGALIGCRLGPYTALALLGVGGMGEVYRAHDSTLGRDVALKILPGPWSADADRRTRFDREARLLASLNHPNIGAIYGVHESDGTTSAEPPVRALVLELVEGETLAERIAPLTAQDGAPRGLPIVDVIAIARQLLDALQAAHARGIVHRDLKPANIKITPDARVKVLDFGLGRAISAADPREDLSSDSSPDLTERATDVSVTRAGLLLGTPAYMSPEQTRGRVVDKRTDIWAFGCVLYEMLTGARAFAGADVAATLANVIRGEVDWSALPSDTPSALRMCLRRCLQKDVAQRIHDTADVRLAMEGAFESRDDDVRTGRGGRAFPAVAYAGWIVAVAVAIVAATVMVPSLRSPVADATEAVAPGATPSVEARAPGTTPPILLKPSAAGGGGSATAATIQEAIDRVAPGGTVQVLPGTYREAITISKGLTLEAGGERTGPVVIAPPGAHESAIDVATAESVTLRGLTVHAPGEYGIRGVGGVQLTIVRATVLAVNPTAGQSRLVDVSNDANATGARARVVIRDSSFDGAIPKTERFEGRPQSLAVSLTGDIDGVVERNVIRRAGAICVRVQTRDDFGGVTNVDILNNDIDECHPVARVGAILVGSPPITTLSPDRPVTASGTVNIVGNVIRNSSQDCLASAIAYDTFSGRIERNRIVDFVQPCAQWTSRNRLGAISIGLRVTGIQMPPVVPSVRFNDIHGNSRAGLHINDNQTIPIDASCNYWGSEEGPSGIGPGNGDAILVGPGAPPPLFLPFAKTPIVGAPDGARPLEQPAPRC
jgi:serine/threonine protein kinase